MNPRNQHRRLYQKIPTFHCKPGCHDDTPKLACPHGCKPKRPLTEQAGKDLSQDYIRMVMV